MGRKASVYSLSLTRGSTWTESFVFSDDETGLPVDLTGFTARMHIRTLAGRYGLSTADTLVMELTTANGRLVITPADGQIDLVVSATDTALLSPLNKRVRYVYGLELVNAAVSPNVVIPFLTGRVSVSPEIIR